MNQPQPDRTPQARLAQLRRQLDRWSLNPDTAIVSVLLGDLRMLHNDQHKEAVMSEDFPPFCEFPKMARLAREIIITEKIDGTNAQIWISEDGAELMAGSRSRWISPSDDNFGFAAWVQANRDELLTLGPGRHYGEWWGSGIQRGYGLTKGDKRFSLFNVSRWGDERPACCGVVPTLYRGDFNQSAIEFCLNGLRRYGSKSAPGFMKPEGIVVFHTAANFGFKRTLEKDELPKSLASA